MLEGKWFPESTDETLINNMITAGVPSVQEP